ncbi:transcriptional regulator [Bacteroidia bacterium]|nr:transcriptional regulator [Bacteroidia bacterium]
MNTGITHIACFFLWLVAMLPATSANNNLDSLLLQLDKGILENDYRTSEKQLYIHRLTDSLRYFPTSSVQRYEMNLTLYKTYRTFVSDSAIHYLNMNIELARQLNDKKKENDCRLKLSSLLSASGVYKEAIDVLERIDRQSVTPSMLTEYYYTQYSVYGALQRFEHYTAESAAYRTTRQAYKDTLLHTLSLDDERRLIMMENSYREAQEYDKALKINDKRLSKYQTGDSNYALVTFHRAIIYQALGDKENKKYYLALSALSDMQTITKDHASLWMLAQQLYEEGDIQHAYRYMRFSWNETRFYNARLRNIQSADILSLVDKTYHASIERQNTLLERYLLLCATLFVFLTVALIYIYLQMKKLSAARNHLQQMNIELGQSNTALLESNQIKEEYIARFMKLCSTYIERLDSYRRMVNKKIMGKQIDELLKITRSQEALDKELEELYVNFDTAFLRLFPNFVKKFNELLQEEARITLKQGELLTVELRIFALIRLGIHDSSQIAEFLRYSVNTIYNYRAKVKNKAKVSREDFETLVSKIR